MSRAEVERVSSVQTLSFTSGTTQSPVSTVADIRSAEVLGLMGATAFGSSTITFAVSPTSSSDGTFVDLYSIASTQISITVSTAAAQAYILPDSLKPWPFMRLVSGSTGEATGRTLKLFTK